MDLHSYLQNTDPIPCEEVNDAAASLDIHELAVLTEILRTHGGRIVSEIDKHKCYGAIVRYYLLCVKQTPDSQSAGTVHSRFEAAHELSALLVHWSQLPEAPQRNEWCEFIVSGVTDLFVEGNEEVRNVIETGFLEHVFEHADLMRLFSSWKVNSTLAPAYEAALAWGIAHRRKSE